MERTEELCFQEVLEISSVSSIVVGITYVCSLPVVLDLNAAKTSILENGGHVLTYLGLKLQAQILFLSS